MSDPLVSVILPVFNAQETLARAIDSILKQSYGELELIIINNGSTDRTKEVITRFGDKRIKYFELPSPNLVVALNFGIENSNGRYIARMDADDHSHEGRLKCQVDLLKIFSDVGLVSGKVNYIGDELKNEGYFQYVNWANGINTPDAIYLSRFQECALPHPSVMFRRSVGEKHGFYKEGNFPEDFELWNRWLYNGVRMSKVDETVLDWHDNPQRLSRNHQMYQTNNFSNIKARYFAKWFKRKFPKSSPEVYVWGAGSSVRQKTRALTNQGIEISKFIDIKQSNSDKLVHYKELEFLPNLFILSYVNDRQGKQEIHQYLLELGYTEGLNFYMME